jgi:hypothetical protein
MDGRDVGGAGRLDHLAERLGAVLVLFEGENELDRGEPPLVQDAGQVGGLVARGAVPVDDVAVFWARVEEVGREAGGFVLEDQGAGLVGVRLGEVDARGYGDQVGDVLVEVDGSLARGR